MALTPFFLDYEVRPRSLRDQLFGVNLSPEDFLTEILERPLMKARHYLRPWRSLAALEKDAGSTIKTDKDKFQVNLDVQHFSPEEISVKTSDGYVVVEGKHEERKDEHGYIARQFTRRYALPENCNPDSVESKLSSDGVLTITAPKTSGVKGERAVPIAHTGPVRRKAREEDEEEEQPNGEPKEETKSPQKKRKR